MKLIDTSTSLVYKGQEKFLIAVDCIIFGFDAENLKLADASLDAVFFGGVLHHIPLLDKVYAEAFRVLKPGGKLVAIEPNRLDVFERIEWALADLRGKLTPNEYPINPLEMRRELIGAKFKSVQFWTIRHDIPVLAQIPLLKYLSKANW